MAHGQGQAQQLLKDLRMALAGGQMKSSPAIASLLQQVLGKFARVLDRAEQLLDDLRMTRHGGAATCSSQAMAASIAWTMAGSWPGHGLETMA